MHVLYNESSVWDSGLVPLLAKKKLNNLRKTADSACVIFPPKAFRILKTPLYVFQAHAVEVLDISWSKNNSLLSASVHNTVRLWKIGYNHCITIIMFNLVNNDYFISGSLRTFQSRGCIRNVVLDHDYSTGSLRLMANGFKVDVDLQRLITHFSRKRTSVHASASQATMSDAVYNPLNDSITEIPSSKIVTEMKKKSKEASLILIRHDESMWNEKNLFTGCVDVPLTQKGVGKELVTYL